ncbi:MAG: hypothetical protein MN733_10085, partial [Nitrososphaera sp.]|nr:hypothetical protein [Nitrososphaera sp.]
MSTVAVNISANYAGKLCSVLFGLVFVPIYINCLGAEAYGLIGLYATLQIVFMMADLGVGNAFTREAARLSALEGQEQHLRDLCRTCEVIMLAAGFLATLSLAVLSHYLAVQWLQAERLPIKAIRESMLMMALT